MYGDVVTVEIKYALGERRTSTAETTTYQFVTDRLWQNKRDENATVWGSEQDGVPQRPKPTFMETADGRGVESLMRQYGRR